MRRIEYVTAVCAALMSGSAGEGSTFTFTLPRERVSEAPPVRAPDMIRVAEAMATA